jgi:pimeloyl-ACP methyl ester carboxylesterase
MNAVTTRDSVEIYYKDWGKGQPTIFSHGRPSCGRAIVASKTPGVRLCRAGSSTPVIRPIAHPAPLRPARRFIAAALPPVRPSDRQPTQCLQQNCLYGRPDDRVGEQAEIHLVEECPYVVPETDRLRASLSIGTQKVHADSQCGKFPTRPA